MVRGHHLRAPTPGNRQHVQTNRPHRPPLPVPDPLRCRSSFHRLRCPRPTGPTARMSRPNRDPSSSPAFHRRRTATKSSSSCSSFALMSKRTMRRIEPPTTVESGVIRLCLCLCPYRTTLRQTSRSRSRWRGCRGGGCCDCWYCWCWSLCQSCRCPMQGGQAAEACIRFFPWAGSGARSLVPLLPNGAVRASTTSQVMRACGCGMGPVHGRRRRLGRCFRRARARMQTHEVALAARDAWCHCRVCVYDSMRNIGRCAKGKDGLAESSL